MPLQEDIDTQQFLLQQHRATLAHYLGQRARLGEAYEPPGVGSGIAEARAEVQRIKSVLRGWDVTVKDLPDDIASPSPRRILPPPQTRFWPFGRRGGYAPDPDVTRQNRQVFINDMRRRYQERLASAPKIIRLRLAERASAVEPPGELVRPYDIARRQPGQADELLPTRTRLLDLYDEHNAQLLILGAPGAGKTFLLYELARDLAERAAADERAPVPVIFSLAAWQPEQTLDAWMVADLSRRYGAKPQLIAHFVGAGMILPLLDGLDEVATLERRKACVNAIDVYRQSRDLLAPPLVVACREREYQDLSALKLNIALVVQPLALAQVRSYLARAAFEGLRGAIERDAGLADMARTPLLLGLMAETYRNHVPEFPPNADAGTLREIVLNDYVAHCCAPRTNDAVLRVPTVRLRAFLDWLARGMVAHGNQQDFYIEFLQPSWLPSRLWWQLWRVLCLGGFGFGFGIVGGIIGGVIGLFTFILRPSLTPGIENGLIVGVIIGLFVGFSTGLRKGQDTIIPIETMSWSFKQFFLRVRRILFFSLLAGIFFGLIIGLLFTAIDDIKLGFGLLSGLKFGLISVIIYGLPISLFIGAFNGVQTSIYSERKSSNQGIHRSLHSSMIGGIVSLLIFLMGFGLFFMWNSADAISAVLLFAAILGLVVGIVTYGGGVVVKHYSLRLILSLGSPAPFNLVLWLEEARMRGLLVRVGGGYRFYHELLQRHFAAHAEPGFPRVPILAERIHPKTGKPSS